MAALEPAAPEGRRKRTIWLLAGGAASLLIPLAGAIYLHLSENAGAPGPSGRSDLFERREDADQKITPTQTVVPPSALLPPPPRSGVAGAAEKPSASSLDFIKGSDELKARIADSKAAAAAPAAPPAPPAPVAAVAESTPTAKPVKPVKPGKKAFTMPKLQPSRGFTNFGSGSGAKSGAPGAPGAAGAAAGAAGGQNSQDILKSLPPGAENDPRVQAYLKAHQNQ